MTLEEAGEIVLSGARPWMVCPRCHGYGVCRVYNGGERLSDSMGNDTDIISIATFICHRCRGKAWAINKDAKAAYERLHMPLPDRPRPYVRKSFKRSK